MVAKLQQFINEELSTPALIALEAAGVSDDILEALERSRDKSIAGDHLAALAELLHAKELIARRNDLLNGSAE